MSVDDAFAVCCLLDNRRPVVVIVIMAPLPPPTYSTQAAWREIQTFLPENLRLTEEADLPKEEVWAWEGHDVHIERCEPANKDSPVNLILLHGKWDETIISDKAG